MSVFLVKFKAGRGQARAFPPKHVVFTPAVYLLITAITAATLLCLFVYWNGALACLHPADQGEEEGGGVSSGRLGRDTAVRGCSRLQIEIEEPLLLS